MRFYILALPVLAALVAANDYRGATITARATDTDSDPATVLSTLTPEIESTIVTASSSTAAAVSSGSALNSTITSTSSTTDSTSTTASVTSSSSTASSISKTSANASPTSGTAQGGGPRQTAAIGLVVGIGAAVLLI